MIDEAKLASVLDYYYIALVEGDYDLALKFKSELAKLNFKIKKSDEYQALLEAYNNAIKNDDEPLYTKLYDIMKKHHNIKW